jgi:molybdopterin molybdotransferase
LHPAQFGLLAAAGLEAAPVYQYPRVAVIATGDGVVAPGTSLRRGQLYASNMVTICAWLSQLALPYIT